VHRIALVSFFRTVPILTMLNWWESAQGASQMMSRNSWF